MTQDIFDSFVEGLSSAKTPASFVKLMSLVDRHVAIFTSKAGFKRAVKALEDELANRSVSAWTAESLTDFIDLMQALGHTNSKNSVPLTKSLIAVGAEAEAAILIDGLLRLRPLAPGYFNLTILIRDASIRENTQQSHFNRLVVMSKNDEAASLLLAKQYMQAGRMAEAADLLENTAHPKEAGYQATLSVIYFWLNKFEAAERLAQFALQDEGALTEKELAALYLHLIKCQITLGKGLAALETLKARRQAFPDIGYDSLEHHAHILLEDFSGAYEGYNRTREVLALTGYSPDLWGARIFDPAREKTSARKDEDCVILCCMGLGDEIRFSRLFDEIASNYAQVTIICDRRMAPIFAQTYPHLKFHGVDRTRAAKSAPPLLARYMDETALEILKGADVVADLKQFTNLYWPLLTESPDRRPPLTIEKALCQTWQDWLAKHADKPTIGLFWRSDLPSHAASVKQSDLSDWLSLIKRPDVQIVPLQYDLTEFEKEQLADDPRIINLPPDLDTKQHIEDVFALLKALPLVISLPGTMQHMAGAVGTPTLCPAHPFEAQWRRYPGRDHDIWSPSVKIISGKAEDGLKGSMSLAVTALEEWLDNQH